MMWVTVLASQPSGEHAHGDHLLDLLTGLPQLQTVSTIRPKELCPADPWSVSSPGICFFRPSSFLPIAPTYFGRFNLGFGFLQGPLESI